MRVEVPEDERKAAWGLRFGLLPQVQHSTEYCDLGFRPTMNGNAAAASMTAEEISQANAFMKFMSRHLVVLSCLYESYDDNGKHFHTGMFAFSGFVINLHDRLFCVTAGHCLDEKFDQPIRAGKLKLLECGFADYFGDKVINTDKIPYSYEPGCAFYIDDETTGLDFGVIPLDILTARGVIANGVKAIGRENWVNQKDLTFEQYKILGIPTHLTGCQISANGMVVGGLQPAMMVAHHFFCRSMSRICC